MHKKSFILVSVVLFVLFIFSGFVCANEDIKKDVSNAVNGVIDGANRLGSDVRNGIGSAENGIEDALKINNNNPNANRNDNVDRNATTAGDYVATRTNTDVGTTNNTSTLWMWLIVAVAAVVIIGLIWYYGAQNNVHHDE